MSVTEAVLTAVFVAVAVVGTVTVVGTVVGIVRRAVDVTTTDVVTVAGLAASSSAGDDEHPAEPIPATITTAPSKTCRRIKNPLVRCIPRPPAPGKYFRSQVLYVTISLGYQVMITRYCHRLRRDCAYRRRC